MYSVVLLGLVYERVCVCVGGYFSRPGDVRVLKDSILEWCSLVRFKLMYSQ